MAGIPNISGQLSPTSGIRDFDSASRGGASSGTVGSVINNFALGGSKLTSDVGGLGSELKTLIWIGAIGGAIALWIYWKRRR